MSGRFYCCDECRRLRRPEPPNDRAVMIRVAICGLIVGAVVALLKILT